MSVKSKHSTSKKDKTGKKEKKKNLEDSEEDIESSEEELDLTKECHPIGYYINDRAEMINQMFSVIKGNKLKAMLPPVLKEYDADQLKLQCLDQLLGMSEKRIMRILEGGTLESSSESEMGESDECGSNEKNGTTSGSSSDGSDESHENGVENNGSRKHKKRKSTSANDGKGGKVAKTAEENSAPEQGKTLLEILELEMRARAIRALLKQSGNDKGSERENDEVKADEGNINGVQESAGEVVDLTECEDEEFPVNVKKEKVDENDFDKKVLTFEKKIEKSKSEKFHPTKEDDKNKKLQAELELRNKLFKKKIYRTRQQRMENDEDDKNVDIDVSKNGVCQTDNVNCTSVVIKTEPVDHEEPEEIILEDPEEGEISTSEDEYPVEIKQEIIEPEESKNLVNDFEPKLDADGERVTAIDNGVFVKNCNVENVTEICNDDVLDFESSQEKGLGLSDEKNEVTTAAEKELKPNETGSILEAGKTESETIEGTSWRDRWLQKDGVQKLVKSSKIFAKVKKRIAEKSQKAKEENPISQDAQGSDNNTNPAVEVIEGSIKEYERLTGKVAEKPKENVLDENKGEEDRNQ